MIKIIGALFLVGGASIIGIYASNELFVRSRVLGSFLASLGIMRAEIGGRLTPICELMEYLAKEVPPPLGFFFAACGKEKREKADTPFYLIWKKNITHAEYLKLKPNEAEVISELGGVLGRYGAEEQISAIAHLERRVSSLAERAENDRKRLGKLYAKLGLLCGVAVVIVFV